MSPSTSSRPVVFVSYSHDSEVHKARVLELSQRLRIDGVDVILDQFLRRPPEDAWPRWMMDELDRASHVLCVCTENYYRAFRGHGRPDRGKGADWEGAIITQVLYDSRSRNAKFIPVLTEPSDAPYVPEPLRGTNCYSIPQDYQALYDGILGQAGVEPAPLGELKVRSRRAAAGSDEPPSAGGSAPGNAEDAEPIREPTPEELEDVLRKVAEAIEETCESAPAAARFLGSATPTSARCVAQENGRWTVSEAYRRGRVDIVPTLQSLCARLNGFSAPRHEWDALELIVGGVLVLSLDPRWVWSQRRSSTTDGVRHPRYAEVVDLGPGDKAQFLAVLATALAGGCVRLERVFGALDSKRVPDLPTAMRGISEADRSSEIKRHFIRFVLGPSDAYDVDSLSGERLDVFFSRVRGILQVASKHDGNPYFAAGSRMAELASEVKRHLQLSDLCLFVPAETGSESELMTNPVPSLTFVQRIFRFIQAKRPSI